MTTALRSEAWTEAVKIDSGGRVTYRYPDRHVERRFTPCEPLDWGDILREVETSGDVTAGFFTTEEVVNTSTNFAWYAEYRIGQELYCLADYTSLDALIDEVFDIIYEFSGKGNFDWMRESSMMFRSVVTYLQTHWKYGESLERWFNQL